MDWRYPSNCYSGIGFSANPISCSSRKVYVGFGMKVVERIRPSDLLAAHGKSIETIIDGVSNEKVYTGLYRPVLEICAAFTQRLPLQDNLFRDMDGAFRFCLILARTAMNTGRDRIFFPGETQKTRRELERQCQYMCFIAAVASGIALLYQNVEVQDSEGNIYHPLTSGIPLFRWYEGHSDCSMAWIPDSPSKKLTPMESAAIAATVFPRGRFSFFNAAVVRMMYSSILPRPDDGGCSTMGKVIRDVISSVMRHYLDREKAVYHPDGMPHNHDDLDVIEVKVKTTECSSEAAQSPKEYSRETQELLRSLRHQKAKREKIIDRIKEVENGYLVPASVFGIFGMKDSSIIKILEDDGLIIERRGASCLMPRMVKPYLYPEEE